MIVLTKCRTPALRMKITAPRFNFTAGFDQIDFTRAVESFVRGPGNVFSVAPQNLKHDSPKEQTRSQL